MTNSEKMFLIASQLNELNKQGKVKCRSGNKEKGYAQVKEVVTGCALYVHHLTDDSLIIDLMVSDNAQGENPYDCNKSIKTFKEIFESVEHTDWYHSQDKTHYDRYFIDVSDLKFNQILGLARKAGSKLH